MQASNSLQDPSISQNDKTDNFTFGKSKYQDSETKFQKIPEAITTKEEKMTKEKEDWRLKTKEDKTKED
jgi:hypothetical protein